MASSRTFGHIPGIPVGTQWSTRVAVAKDKVHAVNQAGISGSVEEGAYSIVISGGYQDDIDSGETIVYCGAGGRDDSGTQIAHQTFDFPSNRALQISAKTRRPVRVVRGADKANRYTPAKGYRYDGLYIVHEAWMERGKSGFNMCKFRLKRYIEDGMEMIPYRRKTVSELKEMEKAAKRAR